MKRRPPLWLLACMLLGLLAACESQPSAPPAAPPTSIPSAPTSAPVAATATLAPTAAAAPAGGSPIIRIASSLPRVGPLKSTTDSIVNSIRMRLSEANFQVCDGRFQLDYQDLNDAAVASGSWEEGIETKNADQAAADADVMIYIGPFDSAAAKLTIPILNRAGLAMISPSNSYTGLTRPNRAQPDEPGVYYPSGQRNYARVVMADDKQGDAGAMWAQQLGVEKLYILDDQQPYGISVADAFEQRAKSLGIQVLGHDPLDPQVTTYSALVAKVKSLGPDLVYFAGDSDVGPLLKELRGAGLTADKLKLMGSDGIQTNSTLAAAAADTGESVYSTIAGLPAERLGPRGQEYYRRYTQQFTGAPEQYGIYGYEAAGVALAALNKVCAKDRAAIRAAVLGTQAFDGALGTWGFDANGDTTLANMQGFVVKSGAFVPAAVFVDGAWEQ